MEIEIGDEIHYLMKNKEGVAWNNTIYLKKIIYQVIEIECKGRHNECYWLIQTHLTFIDRESLFYKDIMENYVKYGNKILYKSDFRDQRIDEIIND